MSLYALIMAGGEGKRFWPVSSKKKPKQFLSLLDDKSLIVQTFERIKKLIPAENIFVVTTENHVEQTRQHLPSLNRDNILGEPAGKNTGPCIYYGCKIVSDIDKDAIVVVLPADHAIKDTKKFIEALNYSVKIADEKILDGNFPLVTLGIKPSRPDTGYGYIEKSSEIIDSSNGFESFRIRNFKEKPDMDTALGYYRNPFYYWNSGIFVWKISSILKEYHTCIPSWERYSEYNFREPGQLADFYDNVTSSPVDKLILEKSDNSLVIPVDFGWSDIGTWQSLDDYQRNNTEENIVKGKVVTHGTHSSFILSSTNRSIVTIGLSGVVIIDSEDGLLIMEKGRSQEVKDVIPGTNTND